MQRASRCVLGSFVVLLSVVFCSAAAAQAQSREKYTISAEAGGVNLISGKVTLQRKGVTHSQPLTAKDDFETGDVVQTGSDGRLEMLLNPGSYMRVAEDSEFALTDASLESLRIKLIKGTFIVEAAGAGDTKLLTEIDTPQTKISIIRKGLYRINVSPNNSTELLVYKGRAVVGNNLLETVKDGKRVVVTGSGNQPELAKFDRKQQDAFGFWSKQRAEILVAANRRLSDRLINSAFSVFNSGWCAQANCAAYSGLWVYDPFLGCRTFLPFYARSSSPYGRSYSNGFGYNGNTGITPNYSSPMPPSNPGNGTGSPAPTTPPPAVVDPPRDSPRRRIPDDPELGDNPRKGRIGPGRPMPIDENERSGDTNRFGRDRSGGANRGGDVDRRIDHSDRGGSNRPHSEPTQQAPTYTPQPSSPPPSYTPPPSQPSRIDRSGEERSHKGRERVEQPQNE